MVTLRRVLLLAAAILVSATLYWWFGIVLTQDRYPASMAMLASARVACRQDTGREPADFREILPYLQEVYRNAGCSIRRVGVDRYIVVINAGDRSARIGVTYRVGEDGSLEEYDAQLLDD